MSLITKKKKRKTKKKKNKIKMRNLIKHFVLKIKLHKHV